MLTATNYKYRNLTSSKVACFISVDPLQFKYPELTPFQYASNARISNIDLDGAEKDDIVDKSKLVPEKYVAEADETYVYQNPPQKLEIPSPEILEIPEGNVSFTLKYNWEYSKPTSDFSRIEINITSVEISDFNFDPNGKPGYTITGKFPYLPCDASRTVNYQTATFDNKNLLGINKSKNWNTPSSSLLHIAFSGFMLGLNTGFFVEAFNGINSPKSTKPVSKSTIESSFNHAPLEKTSNNILYTEIQYPLPRACTGGEFSKVNGEFYKAGRMMPGERRYYGKAIDGIDYKTTLGSSLKPPVTNIEWMHPVVRMGAAIGSSALGAKYYYDLVMKVFKNPTK